MVVRPPVTSRRVKVDGVGLFRPGQVVTATLAPAFLAARAATETGGRPRLVPVPMVVAGDPLAATPVGLGRRVEGVAEGPPRVSPQTPFLAGVSGDVRRNKAVAPRLPDAARPVLPFTGVADVVASVAQGPPTGAPRPRTRARDGDDALAGTLRLPAHAAPGAVAGREGPVVAALEDGVVVGGAGLGLRRGTVVRAGRLPPAVPTIAAPVLETIETACPALAFLVLVAVVVTVAEVVP